MKEKGQKYVIRESELKEIIKEMILTELYNPNDYRANFVNGRPAEYRHIKDIGKSVGNILKGIPGALISDEDKERIQSGDNDFLRWLLGSLNASPEGSTGPDYVPNLTSLRIFGGPGWGKGNNSDAHEVFNPQLAVRGILGRATPRYIRGQNGYCARAVRMALQDGGLSCPWGMNADEAKDYLTVLPNNGWQEIAVNDAVQPGDIVVISAFNGHPYGHIAMCVGGGRWVSDFVQNSMLGINGGVPQGCIHTFRYTNIKGQQRGQ
jgi:hypothetical protein